jgi:beta-lactamase regulating signal transducer with metallopeptidase domain
VLNLLLLLLSWVLWTSVLAGLLQLGLRHSGRLAGASYLTPLLLLVSLLPLLPWPQQVATLPDFWLAPHDYGVSPMLALPAHPGWLEQQPLQALLPELALWLLLAGCVLSVGLTLHQWLLWRRLHTLSEPLSWQRLAPVIAADPALQRALQRYALQLWQLPHGASPFVSGIWQFKLWLPDWFWQLPPEQQRLLLWHELQHLQRRDPLWLLSWRLLCAWCWFNPALRLLERHYQSAMEHRVDQWVLSQHPAQRSLYARTLLAVVRAQQQAAQSTCWLQANAGMGPAQVLQQRLQQILQPVSALTGWRLSLLLLSVVSLSVPALALKIELTGLAPQQWHAPLAQGRISSGFGEIHSFRRHKPHGGLDFVAARGAPVLAIAAGKVLLSGSGSLHPDLGHVVLVDHGGGYQSMLAHLDTVLVTPGQQVQPGQPLGTLGNSGRTTGPHLHLELLQDGVRIDPTRLLPLHRSQGATGE